MKWETFIFRVSHKSQHTSEWVRSETIERRPFALVEIKKWAELMLLPSLNGGVAFIFTSASLTIEWEAPQCYFSAAAVALIRVWIPFVNFWLSSPKLKQISHNYGTINSPIATSSLHCILVSCMHHAGWVSVPKNAIKSRKLTMDEINSKCA